MLSKKVFFLALAVVVTAAGAICMSRKKKRDDPFSENEPSDENPSEANPPCGEQATSSQEEVDLIISKANQSEETLLKSWEEDINALKVSWSEHPYAEKFPSLCKVLGYTVACGFISGEMLVKQFTVTRTVASAMLELLTKHHIVQQPQHPRTKRVVNLTEYIWNKVRSRIDLCDCC